jgi:MFS family permease
MITNFRILLAAAFLWGCGSTQLILLAVLLKAHGMSGPEIAAIASMLTVSQIVSTVVCGTLATRYGVVRTLQLGAVIAFIGVVILSVTYDSMIGSALGNFIRGFGFGMVLPAGQMFTQNEVAESDRSRAVAIFSAMSLIPAFFGPSIGQFTLTRLGDAGFFAVAILPMLVALATVMLLPRLRETSAQPDASGYLKLLRDRQLWLPNFATMQGGLAYAFAWTFLPLLLIEFTPVAAFFTPFAVSVIATRFIGMKRLQLLLPAHVVALGLTAYLVGLTALLSPTMIAAIAAGLLFGFGYGVTSPSCIEWSTRLYPNNRRPVALINTSFHIGSIIALQLTGLLLVFGGMTVIIVLAVLVGCVLALLLASQFRSKTIAAS